MSATTCTPNIGAQQVRRRWRGGWVALGLALALGVLLIVAGAPRWARLALFIPCWAAGLGFFQARERT